MMREAPWDTRTRHRPVVDIHLDRVEYRNLFLYPAEHRQIKIMHSLTLSAIEQIVHTWCFVLAETPYPLPKVLAWHA